MDFSQPGVPGQHIQHGSPAGGNISSPPALNHSDFVDVPLGSPDLSSARASTEMVPRVSSGDEDKATTAVVFASHCYSVSGATAPSPRPASTLQTVAPIPSSASTASTLAHPGFGSVSQASPIPHTTGAVSVYEEIPTGNRDGKVIPPPPHPPPAPQPVTLPDDTAWTFPPITENEAKRALLKYARRKCCYGSSPARQMTIRELRSHGLYRYRLETFTESRACKWVTARYVGQDVDSPADGHTPQPWDIPVQVAVLFKDGIHTITVPYSTSVKMCSKCNGMGQIICLKCHGVGRTLCSMCNAPGRRKQIETCRNCYGNRIESCTSCHDIPTPCVACWGRGRILNYIQMTVTWKNNVFEFVENHNTAFPSELFKKASGEIIFKDEQVVVAPLLDAPVPLIRNASQDAHTQHRNLFLYCRILRQRQCVEWLPLTRMEYTWQGNDFSCYLYGKDHLVHTVTYPMKCCCISM